MNDFVEQCLMEWRRIGVPDAIANEMASDLEADLSDAAADHVPPEEVLGNGIFDAPSFARSWAAARGVIPPAPPTPTPSSPVAPSDGRRVVALALGGLAVMACALLTLVVFHPFARAVAVRRAAFVGPGVGSHPGMFARPGLIVGHPAAMGAPGGVFLAFGVLVIAALAGSSWFLWHRP
jgi:hypothetical protein